MDQNQELWHNTSCSVRKVAARGDGGKQVFFFELAFRQCERTCWTEMCVFFLHPAQHDAQRVKERLLNQSCRQRLGVSACRQSQVVRCTTDVCLLFSVFFSLLPSRAILLAWEEVPHWPPEHMCDCLSVSHSAHVLVRCRRQCQRPKQHERLWASMVLIVERDAALGREVAFSGRPDGKRA